MKLAVAALGLCLAVSLNANRFYVDKLAAPGGDGSTWGTACNTLQDALDQTVGGRGDEVWIAAGTYQPDDGVSVTPGNRYASFILRDGVTLAGGFAGTETSLEERDLSTNKTILSGAISPDQADWSLHVLRSEGNAALDGLTVSHGNANLEHEVHGNGGGVFSENFILFLDHCRLENNSALLNGGAIYGEVDALNSTFNGNYAGGSGGAIFGDCELQECDFLQNSTAMDYDSYGGAISGLLTADQCQFYGNQSMNGGAIESEDSLMSNCTLSDNSAGYCGGAIYGFADLTGCQVSYNEAFLGGAILGGASLDECSIEGNLCDGYGGGIAGNVTAANSTFYRNFSLAGGGAVCGDASLRSCLISDNFAANFEGDGSGGGVLGMTSAVDCIFNLNVSYRRGGAASGGGSFMNCVFEYNTAPAGTGGAVFGDCQVVNSHFAHNEAITPTSDWWYAYAENPNGLGAGEEAGHGGAIAGTVTIMNSSFTGNVSDSGDSILYQGDSYIINSVISNHDGIALYSISDTASISNRLDTAASSPRAANLIEGGMAAITGTGTVDFGDPGIYLVSSAIDTGVNSLLPPDTFDLDGDSDTSESLPRDLNGNPRIQNDFVDLGPIEYGGDFPPVEVTVNTSARPEGTGQVTQSGEGLYSLWDLFEIMAAPDPGYLFSNWGGDYAGNANPATISANGDLWITANFIPDTNDDDGDGLTNYDEVIIYGTDPELPDTNGDGILDGEAVANGLDPATDYSGVVNLVVADPIRFGVDPQPWITEGIESVLSDPHPYGLYSESEIMFMHVGELMLKREDGPLLLNFAIEVSDDLDEWEVAEVIEREVDPGPDKVFLRVDVGLPKVDIPGFVPVPAGTFLMGLPEGEPGSYAGDTQHLVTLNRPFYIKQTEVTYAEWQEVRDWTLLPENSGLGYALPTGVMGANIAASTPQHPVTHVSWYAALAWCNARSEMEGRQPAYYIDAAHSAVYRDGTADFQNAWVDWEADGYRLPTEAEWEYACRAGTTTSFYTGPITATQFRFCENLDAAGWYGGNSGNNTHPVGEKVPNLIGLSDTHGNVWEWVWDRHEDFTPSPTIDPLGPDTGTDRLMRGGSYNNNAENCQSSSRFPNPPVNSGAYGGFRAAISR